MEDQTKVCSKCTIEKYVSEFYSKKTGRFGVTGECKNCIIERNSVYRIDNPGKRSTADKVRYAKDPSKANEAVRQWTLKNAERKKSQMSAWYIANRRRVLDRQKTYNANNPEVRSDIAKRCHEKRVSTPQGRLEHTIRANFLNGINKGSKAGRKTFDILGYSVDELKLHLESQFAEGMSWENHSLDGWHIDHKRPLASFSYTTPDCPEFKEAWALSNLQPLWAFDNLSKGARYQLAA